MPISALLAAKRSLKAVVWYEQNIIKYVRLPLYRQENHNRCYICIFVIMLGNAKCRLRKMQHVENSINMQHSFMKKTGKGVTYNVFKLRN